MDFSNSFWAGKQVDRLKQVVGKPIMAAVNTLKRAIFADLSPPPKRRATFPERGSPEVGPAPVWDPQEEEEETLIVEGGRKRKVRWAPEVEEEKKQKSSEEEEEEPAQEEKRQPKDEYDYVWFHTPLGDLSYFKRGFECKYTGLGACKRQLPEKEPTRYKKLFSPRPTHGLVGKDDMRGRRGVLSGTGKRKGLLLTRLEMEKKRETKKNQVPSDLPAQGTVAVDEKPTGTCSVENQGTRNEAEAGPSGLGVQETAAVKETPTVAGSTEKESTEVAKRIASPQGVLVIDSELSKILERRSLYSTNHRSKPLKGCLKWPKDTCGLRSRTAPAASSLLTDPSKNLTDNPGEKSVPSASMGGKSSDQAGPSSRRLRQSNSVRAYSKLDCARARVAEYRRSQAKEPEPVPDLITRLFGESKAITMEPLKNAFEYLKKDVTEVEMDEKDQAGVSSEGVIDLTMPDEELPPVPCFSDPFSPPSLGKESRIRASFGTYLGDDTNTGTVEKDHAEQLSGEELKTTQKNDELPSAPGNVDTSIPSQKEVQTHTSVGAHSDVGTDTRTVEEDRAGLSSEKMTNTNPMRAESPPLPAFEDGLVDPDDVLHVITRGARHRLP